jgi:hypothetical protein
MVYLLSLPPGKKSARVMTKERDMSDPYEDFDRQVSQLAGLIYNEQAAAVRLIDRVVAKGPQTDMVPAGCTNPPPRPGIADQEQFEAAHIYAVQSCQTFSELLLMKAREIGFAFPTDNDAAADWIGRFRKAYARFYS